MFVHADSRPPPALVQLVRATLQRPGVVLAAFRPVIGAQLPWEAGVGMGVPAWLGRAWECSGGRVDVPACRLGPRRPRCLHQPVR